MKADPIHRLDNPPDYHRNLPRATKPDRELLTARGLVQNLFLGVSLEVRARGFAVVGSALVLQLHTNAGTLVKVSDIQATALEYGLTAMLDRRRGLLVFRRFHASTEQAAQDMTRAGGEVVCPTCGFEFREHPKDSRFKFLQVLCDGRRVKL